MVDGLGLGIFLSLRLPPLLLGNHFLGKLAVILRPMAGRGVGGNRYALRGAFGEPDVFADQRLEEHRGNRCPDVGYHLLGMAGLGLPGRRQCR